jgi:hypothetical protein
MKTIADSLFVLNHPLIGKFIAVSQRSLANDRTLLAYQISLKIFLLISPSISAVKHLCQLYPDVDSPVKRAAK